MSDHAPEPHPTPDATADLAAAPTDGAPTGAVQVDPGHEHHGHEHHGHEHHGHEHHGHEHHGHEHHEHEHEHVGFDDAGPWGPGPWGPGSAGPSPWGPPPWARRRGGRPWGPPGMMADDEHRGSRGRGRRRGPGGPGGPGGDPGWAAGGGGWGGPGGPGRGGPPPGARWGRGHRRGRGEVRVAVLFLLDEQPMHGYQIIRELTDRTGGRWRPSPGAVYPTLQLLEDEGLVTADEQGGKRVFTLTEDGTAEVARVKEARHAPWTGGDGADGADDPVDQLRTAYLQLGAAARQVADAGTPAQQEAARALLDGARKAIYGILAED